jgi:hypothetical protein
MPLKMLNATLNSNGWTIFGQAGSWTIFGQAGNKGFSPVSLIDHYNCSMAEAVRFPWQFPRRKNEMNFRGIAQLEVFR